MRKIIFPIIIIGALVASFIVGSLVLREKSAEETEASVSKTGLTLELNFGNNNGAATPKVYDSSGNARHATAANAQTCSASMCTFDGTGDYMSGTGTGVFNGTNIGMVFKFRPDSAADDDTYEVLMDGTAASRYGIHKGADSNNNTLFIILGGTTVETIALTTYQQYWKKSQDNILVLSATSGDTNVWLNGVKILSADATTWTAGDPATYYIGASYLGTSLFDGNIYYLKVWNRLLTDAEVDTLTKDRKIATDAPSYSATSTGRLVGWFTLDQNDINGATIYDKSGQGYHGAFSAGVNSTSTAGKIGQGLYFDGSNGQIGITALNWRKDTTSAFAWLKPESTNLTRSVVTSGDVSGPSTTNWGLRINSGEIQIDGDASLLTSSGANIVLNQWNHIGFTNDGATTRIYLNGSEVTNGAHTINNNNTTGEKIGSVGAQDILGSIDDVRVYGYALTAQNVVDLYNATKIKRVNSATKTGLVGYWNMDSNDVNGTLVYDKSGNGNNGTISGAACGNSGKINQSCLFDADGDYISVGTSAALQPANLTFAAWVRRTSSWNNQAIGIFWAKPSGVFDSTSGWHITSDDGANENTPIVLRVSGNNYCYVTADIDTFYPLNEWTHIAGTFNSTTNACSLYKNGVAVTTANSGTPDVINSSADIKYIGLNNGYASSMDDGLMDEVRVYNYDFSAREIANLYNAAKRSYQ